MKLFLAVLVMININEVGAGSDTCPDVSSLKTDVSHMKADIDCIKRDIAALLKMSVTTRKLKTTPIVLKRQLVSSWISDLAVTSCGRIVTTGGATRIYDHNYNLIKDIGKSFWYVTVTSDDQLVFTVNTRDIYFYSVDGILIRTLTVKGSPTNLRGITTLSNGQLVVTDTTQDGVYTVDPATGVTTLISMAGTFITPFHVTTNSKDEIIVSDYSRHFVKGLDKDGSELFSYGTFGTGDGQMMHNTGVCTDMNDYIVVADQNNNRIHLLTPDGNFKMYLLTNTDGLYNPKGVGVNQYGELLVADVNGQLFTITYRE